MSDLNHATLTGRLVRDPLMRHCAGGTLMGWFTIASNHRYKDKAGNMQEETAFVSCKVFGGWAEALADYRKGDMLLVSGRFRTENWEKDGAQQWQLVLVCDLLNGVSSGTSATRSGEPVSAGEQGKMEPAAANGKPPF